MCSVVFFWKWFYYHYYISLKIESKCNDSYSTKCIWKCCLQTSAATWLPFCSGYHVLISLLAVWLPSLCPNIYMTATCILCADSVAWYDEVPGTWGFERISHTICFYSISHEICTWFCCALCLCSFCCACIFFCSFDVLCIFAVLLCLVFF